MRKFSEDVVPADDREFEVLGETFRWRYPSWQEVTDQIDRETALLQQKNGDAPAEGETQEEPETTLRAIYQDYVDRIGTFIDPSWNDGPKRWKALTSRKDSPVPAYLIMEIWNWLMEVTTRSPTKLPSASADGPQTTEATSKAGSS